MVQLEDNAASPSSLKEILLVTDKIHTAVCIGNVGHALKL